MLDNAQKQSLRETVVEYLAKRPTAKFTISAMCRNLTRAQMVDFPFSEADVAEVLALLEGFGYTQKLRPPLGSIPEHQITSQGVLFHERNQ